MRHRNLTKAMFEATVNGKVNDFLRAHEISSDYVAQMYAREITNYLESVRTEREDLFGGLSLREYLTKKLKRDV